MRGRNAAVIPTALKIGISISRGVIEELEARPESRVCALNPGRNKRNHR